jgi:hypothetical protein
MLLHLDVVRMAKQMLLQCDDFRTAPKLLLPHVLALLGNYQVYYVPSSQGTKVLYIYI